MWREEGRSKEEESGNGWRDLLANGHARYAFAARPRLEAEQREEGTSGAGGSESAVGWNPHEFVVALTPARSVCLVGRTSLPS